MKDFIFSNWASIAAILIGLINLLIIIFKKKITFVDGVWSKLIEHLPEVICTVETSGEDGVHKKAMAYNWAVSYLCDAYDISKKKCVSLYGSRISSAIEDILACPQKKGVN